VAEPKTSIVIPEELKKKHPELIEFILGSESMNDEERQYWINILPIMTPEQIQELRTILENERTQLKAIDEKYAKEIERIGEAQVVKRVGEERRRRRTTRAEEEDAHKRQEQEQTDTLLEQIEGESKP
jgi:DNA-directed RNA polymerase subunit F